MPRSFCSSSFALCVAFVSSGWIPVCFWQIFPSPGWNAWNHPPTLLTPHAWPILKKNGEGSMCTYCVFLFKLYYGEKRKGLCEVLWVTCTRLFCSSELLLLDTNQAGKLFHFTKGSGLRFCSAKADQNTPVRGVRPRWPPWAAAHRACSVTFSPL